MCLCFRAILCLPWVITLNCALHSATILADRSLRLWALWSAWTDLRWVETFQFAFVGLKFYGNFWFFRSFCFTPSQKRMKTRLWVEPKRFQTSRRPSKLKRCLLAGPRWVKLIRFSIRNWNMSLTIVSLIEFRRILLVWYFVRGQDEPTCCRGRPNWIWKGFYQRILLYSS